MPRATRQWLPYALVAPAILIELVVHVVPIVLGISMSFLRLNQFDLATWTHAPFAGLQNYRDGLSTGVLGSEFYAAALRTLLFGVVVVGLSWAIGMFAAVLLTSQFRGREFFRAYFLIPFALPAYVTGIGWRFMFERDNGALNHLLIDDLHLSSHRPFWLVGGNAFWACALVGVWRMWPFAYLMLLAALQVVPREEYEAAAMDGAWTWRQFWSVTMPAVRRMNRVVVLVMVLWCVNEFTLPYVIFGQDPPASARLLPSLIYRDAFGTYDTGLAAALDVIVVLALLIFGVAYARRVLPREALDG